MNAILNFGARAKLAATKRAGRRSSDGRLLFGLEGKPLAVLPISPAVVFPPSEGLAIVPDPVERMNYKLHTLRIVVALDRVPAFSRTVANDRRRRTVPL